LFSVAGQGQWTESAITTGYSFEQINGNQTATEIEAGGVDITSNVVKTTEGASSEDDIDLTLEKVATYTGEESVQGGSSATLLSTADASINSQLNTLLNTNSFIIGYKRELVHSAQSVSRFPDGTVIGSASSQNRRKEYHLRIANRLSQFKICVHTYTITESLP